MADRENPTKTYYVITRRQFEILIMQMRTPKAQKIRELYLKIKEIILVYVAYENHCNSANDENYAQNLSEINSHMKNIYAAINDVREDVHKFGYAMDDNQEMLQQTRQQINNAIIYMSQQVQASLSQQAAKYLPCLRSGGTKRTGSRNNSGNDLVMYRTGKKKWYFVGRWPSGFYKAERVLFKLELGAVIQRSFRSEIWNSFGSEV